MRYERRAQCGACGLTKCYTAPAPKLPACSFHQTNKFMVTITPARILGAAHNELTAQIMERGYAEHDNGTIKITIDYRNTLTA